MTRLQLVALTGMCLFGAMVMRLAILPAHGSAIEEADIPPHLRDRPSSLSVRLRDKIVEAPSELLELARTYPQFSGKGKVVKGRRITVMADKVRCRVGEPVRLLHVLEAVTPGLEVYVMGPKPVYDEFVDGKNARPRPVDQLVECYDGRVIPSPAVDFHYDITSYRFDKPGRHTIQWKCGGHPIEGDLHLESNMVAIDVVK